MSDNCRVGIQVVDRSSGSKSRASKKLQSCLWLIADNRWAPLRPRPGPPWTSARLTSLFLQTLTHLCLLSSLAVLPSSSCKS